MARNLVLKAGCTVPFPEKLFEGYETGQHCIFANVGVDKIESMMQHFIAMHDEPLFFILELPCRKEDETEIGPGKVEKLHKDVYYIDGCSQGKALSVLSQVGGILFHDGMSVFGFGGHYSQDEILFGKYNVVTIYTKNQEAYADFFSAHEIEPTKGLVTAWQTFSRDYPGVSNRYEADGKSAFDIPEQLKDLGIYFAERREEK